MEKVNADYTSVAEDIEWLRTKWWEEQGQSLTDADIRRGSASIHLLGMQGLLGRAWRHFGFTGQPKVKGPDLVALCSREGHLVRRAVSLVGGGGRLNGIDLAFIGAFRADNPATGISGDADEGFAVVVTYIARDARSPITGPLDALVEPEWPITNYLAAPGAVRRGEEITRGQVIDYFRNYVGGAHHDLVKNDKRAKTDTHDLTHELVDRVRADTRSGLYFELLSIGQAIGRSLDINSLEKQIRSVTT